MSTIKCFEDIEAWQAGRELVKQVYGVSGRGKFDRDLALKNQVRRSSVSICSNIAEGFERDGRAEFIQFLSQSKGSSGELRSQLYHALDLGYITQEQFEELRANARSVSAMLGRFISYLRAAPVKGTKFKRRPA
jgi:four helix bundle protein